MNCAHCGAEVVKINERVSRCACTTTISDVPTHQGGRQAADDASERPSPPFQRHSTTSREAAASKVETAPTERGRVLAFLRACGIVGATDDQMQIMLEMNPSTQRPRRVELVEMGHVFDSGVKAKTRTGRNATVWRAR